MDDVLVSYLVKWKVPSLEDDLESVKGRMKLECVMASELELVL